MAQEYTFAKATGGLICEKYCRYRARRVNFCEHHIDLAGSCHSGIVCYLVLGYLRAGTWNVLVYGGVMFGIAR